MRRRIAILASMIGMGSIYAAIAGSISSAAIASFLLAPNLFGITLGLGFGAMLGFFAGGILGAIVGAVAGMITAVFDKRKGFAALYKFSMGVACTLLSTFLVFITARYAFSEDNPVERNIILALTGSGALSGLILSLLLAKSYRKLIEPRMIYLPPSA